MSVDGIVLVHGGVHSSRCWAQVVPHLTAPVIAVDLPGRGSRPADLDAVTLADCVCAVIEDADDAGFDRFTLVGHSVGGVTITETTWQHPDRVSHRIYVGALVPAPGASASIVMTGADLPARQPILLDEAVARTLFANDLSDQQWAEYWKEFVPEAVGIMNARLSGYPLGVQTTYISMSDDVPVPPEVAEQMIANLGAGVEHRVLPGGHSVIVSRPRELAAAINEIVGQARASDGMAPISDIRLQPGENERGGAGADQLVVGEFLDNSNYPHESHSEIRCRTN